MHFAIRYLTEYRYDGAGHRQPQRAAGQAGDDATQRVEDFGVRVDPEARLHQHLDYFGTTVIEFGISRPHEHLVDRRPRAGARPRRRTSRRRRPWAALEDRAYGAAAGEFLLPDGPEPRRPGARRARRR